MKMAVDIEGLINFVAAKDGVQPCDVEWYSWPQVFGSTSGPRGGVGGCSMTSFQVFAFYTGISRYKYCAGIWQRWNGEFQCRW